MGLTHRLTVAEAIGPLAARLLGGELPLRIEFWDGSSVGPEVPPAPWTLQVRSRDALVRLLWRPDELGLARAYIAGDLDVDGDLYELLAVMLPIVHRGMRLSWTALPAGLSAAARVGLLRPPAPGTARGGPTVRRPALDPP